MNKKQYIVTVEVVLYLVFCINYHGISILQSVFTITILVYSNYMYVVPSFLSHRRSRSRSPRDRERDRHRRRSRSRSPRRHDSHRHSHHRRSRSRSRSHSPKHSSGKDRDRDREKSKRSEKSSSSKSDKEKSSKLSKEKKKKEGSGEGGEKKLTAEEEEIRQANELRAKLGLKPLRVWRFFWYAHVIFFINSYPSISLF